MYNLQNNNDAFIRGFVEKHSLDLPPTKINKKRPNGLRAFQSELYELISLCDDIDERKENLKRSICEWSPEKWKELKSEIDDKIERAETLKSTIFDENRLKLVSKNLKTVKNRRQRLKRKKIEAKNSKILSIAESKNVDDLIKKKKEDLKKNIVIEENKLKTEKVLKDVTRKKLNAKRSIQLLDAMCKLRTAREKSALGRGEKISLESSAMFTKNIDKLKLLWHQAMDDYDKEEIKLRSTLQDTVEVRVEEITNVTKAKTLSEQLKESLFGDTDDTLPQRFFYENMDQFLFVRAQWDQYVSKLEDSSRIPIGWVVSDTPKSEAWVKYLTN